MVFALFLIVISFLVFLSNPKSVSQVLVFNKPKVNVDIKIFDSDQFKNLQPFTEMQTQYSYVATDKDNKETTGFIAAASIEEARSTLESMDLSVSELKEAEIGRDNPFTPYSQITVASTTTVTTKTTTTKTTVK